MERTNCVREGPPLSTKVVGLPTPHLPMMLVRLVFKIWGLENTAGSQSKLNCSREASVVVMRHMRHTTTRRNVEEPREVAIIMLCVCASVRRKGSEKRYTHHSLEDTVTNRG